jgi:hypothetical protein
LSPFFNGLRTLRTNGILLCVVWLEEEVITIWASLIFCDIGGCGRFIWGSGVVVGSVQGICHIV